MARVVWRRRNAEVNAKFIPAQLVQNGDEMAWLQSELKQADSGVGSIGVSGSWRTVTLMTVACPIPFAPFSALVKRTGDSKRKAMC